MIVLGLTGNIGMGKTTVAAEFARLGVPVCNADTIVHRLLAQQGAAVPAVAALFPEVLEDGAINRQKLGAIVFSDKEKRSQLEAIIHPLVKEAEFEFVKTQQRAGKKLAVVEIPLLYEVGADKRCDKVLVVTARPEIQKERVMKREHMSEEKFARILSIQLPDKEKRARADFVIDTSGDMQSVQKQVKALMEALHA